MPQAFYYEIFRYKEVFNEHICIPQDIIKPRTKETVLTIGAYFPHTAHLCSKHLQQCTCMLYIVQSL